MNTTEKELYFSNLAKDNFVLAKSKQRARRMLKEVLKELGLYKGGCVKANKFKGELSLDAIVSSKHCENYKSTDSIHYLGLGSRFSNETDCQNR